MSAGIPFIPAAMLGILGHATGSLEHAFVAADCIFPALLFLLLWHILTPVTSTIALRLFLTWAALLVPFGLLNSIWLGDDALLAPLEFTRTPQPEISFVILLLAAMLLGRALQLATEWRWAVAAGIASGAVVYCYYFYAIAWGITLGALLLLGVIWKDRRLVRCSAVSLAAMIVLSVPFVIATLRGRMQGGQGELLARMGAATHRPAWLALLIAIGLTVALLRAGRPSYRVQPTFLVLGMLMIAAFYGMNFQIISGYETQPWHFWKRLAVPVAFILLEAGAANVISGFFAQSKKRLSVVANAALVILLLNTAARLCYAAVQSAPFHRASDPEISLVIWVRNNMAPGQVIGTVNPELILLLPALSANYNYVPSGLRSLTSTAEIESRYMEFACFLELKPEAVAEAAKLPSHRSRSSELLHVLGLSYVHDPVVYREFVNRYEREATSCQGPHWRLDAAIVSNAAQESAILRRFPRARVIYASNRYRLFDLRDN